MFSSYFSIYLTLVRFFSFVFVLFLSLLDFLQYVIKYSYFRHVVCLVCLARLLDDLELFGLLFLLCYWWLCMCVASLCYYCFFSWVCFCFLYLFVLLFLLRRCVSFFSLSCVHLRNLLVCILICAPGCRFHLCFGVLSCTYFISAFCL